MFLDFLLTPFFEYEFMRAALFTCFIVATSSVPLGAFLVLQRMSLMGEAFSHGIFPGIVISFIVFGVSMPCMIIGGIFVGLMIISLSRIVKTKTIISEDAAFAGLYLFFLSIGILVIAIYGTQMRLMTFLFGSIFGVDTSTFFWLLGLSICTIVIMLLIYKPLIFSCFDPLFCRIMFGKNFFYAIFLFLLCINIVSALQAMGSMMAVGFLVLPVLCCRPWTNDLSIMIFISTIVAFFASYVGLLISYNFDWPLSPAIIFVLGVMYVMSIGVFISKNLYLKRV